MKSKKNKPQNIYVIRKMVRATSISDAIKKEKDQPVLEVHLVISEEKPVIPQIGFSYSDLNEVGPEK